MEQRIQQRVQAIDYRHWRAKVTAVGGCSAPVRLGGAFQLQNLQGAVLEHRGGELFSPCGNRRESVCPSCSDRYSADAFHLMRAGLSGGAKDVPIDVRERPRLFVTLTAPSFGPVHSRRTSARGRTMPCRCGDYHHPDDPRIGAPLDPDSYDYRGAVLWQGNASTLWARTMTRLRRLVAHAAGLTVRDFPDHARLSYAKVAEYQRRGLVHFHAVLRLDGPEGAADRSPDWATTDLLTRAVQKAAHTAEYRDKFTGLTFSWGDQVDVRPIRADQASEVEDARGGISEGGLAAYVAKYATKGTGKSEAADRPIRSQAHLDALDVSPHHRRMMQTAWDLGGIPALGHLRHWAHMLGFRGHFLSKSKKYSTTFKRLREDRREYRLNELLNTLGVERDSVVVVNSWEFLGTGYRSDAEREIAEGIYEGQRAQRQQKYQQEGNQQ
ncbi:replication initiator [Actinoalloteichus hymeniacidonis]|uniref:replication initiator n=1 Tax=Actinoalloteichus hymeniacidonis TaxID=340345 RepID=UPI00288C05EA|nr:replication initiator [Actinoalloteichus hymeniacidonis]